MTTFANNSRLQAFLYYLVRDVIPLGKVEAILADLEDAGDVTPVFSEENLAAWASSVVPRLISTPHLVVTARGGKFDEDQVQRIEEAVRAWPTCGTANGSDPLGWLAIHDRPHDHGEGI